jgi:hypothetical protein
MSGSYKPVILSTDGVSTSLDAGTNKHRRNLSY